MKKPSLVPAGMTLAGDIEGDEDLLVHGRVDGDVRVSGTLVIEAAGVVRGDVQGRSVTVRGVVAGDAWAEELVRVDEGGRVVGDVTAPRVKVVEGARLRGRVRMGDEATALPPQPLGRSAGERVAPAEAGPPLESVRPSSTEPAPPPEGPWLTEPAPPPEGPWLTEPAPAAEGPWLTEPAPAPEADEPEVEAEPEPEARTSTEPAPPPEAEQSPRRPPAPRMPALGRRRAAFRARTG